MMSSAIVAQAPRLHQAAESQGGTPDDLGEGEGGSGRAEGFDADAPPQGWEAIGPISTRKKADEWRFVLHAVRVGSWVAPAPDNGFMLMVHSAQAAQAVREIREYEQENRERAATRTVRDVPLYRRSWWALAIVAALVGFFNVTGPSQLRAPWFLVGTADSQAILGGAIYESVTALTLHADNQHVLGNALVGGLFLTVLHRRFGAGLGTFLVVTAGATGNLMNAAWHGAGHRSLGASTAVMAALGALAVTQFVLDRTRQPNRKIVLTWAPILAGLALLGTFGASPNSDLHAHGFGFVAGVVFGLIAAVPLRKREAPLPTWAQIGFGAAAAALVVGSWLAAFGLHGYLT